MKISVLIGATALFTASLQAADSKDEVTNAAKNLAGKSNYSWRSTVEVPDDAQFRPGPTEGEIETGKLIHFTSSFNDNVTHTYIKGDKGAISDQYGDYQSLDELENEEGFARFRAIRARTFKAPAEQAIDLAAASKSLKKDGESYASDLTEEGVKSLMRFGGRDGPTISNAKGSVKFWLKDGMLAKYEFSAVGTMDFNGNDFEIDRVTTVEIKNVGTTKIIVSDAAEKKLK